MSGAIAASAASTLTLYRDDGPLARALGASLSRLARGPAPLLLVAGAAPFVAVLAFSGDDYPLALAAAVAWLVILGGLSSARPQRGRFGWLAPPILRAVEYGGLLWFAVLHGEAAVPACFAFLAAAAFRHYDTVYRVRHQGVAAAAWVRNLSGGWDGRVVLGCLLLVTGALTAGLYVAAVLLAVMSVSESIAAWLSFNRGQRPSMYADEEDEDE